METVNTLASARATVIVPARDIAKVRVNLKGIEHVEIEEIDLMNPDSIDSFAAKFLSSGRALNLLINNAGIMFAPLRRDIRGVESQLATNYLATFQLTARSWTALKNAEGGRVINISFQGHQFGTFNFDDPNY